MQIVVISGRSGSGKTSALHLLEDEGFTCIDNLPVSLIPNLVNTIRQGRNSKDKRLAVGIDARNIDGDLSSLPQIFSSLKKSDDEFRILYLDTSSEVLLRRFSETRRRHPLSDSDTGLRQAISEEDIILSPLAALADVTIDTTQLNLHELRSMVKREVVGDEARGISLQLTSFGFKFGVPPDADFVYDVRCLPNPYWEIDLRDHSGQEDVVKNFLSNSAPVQEMIEDIYAMALRWLPSFENNNRSYLNIAVGCTGGMHRSVFIVEELALRIAEQYQSVQVHHRQLNKK